MSWDGPALPSFSSNNKECPFPSYVQQPSLFPLLLGDQDEIFMLKIQKCSSCYHLTYAFGYSVQLETRIIYHWNPSYRAVD